MVDVNDVFVFVFGWVIGKNLLEMFIEIVEWFKVVVVGGICYVLVLVNVVVGIVDVYYLLVGLEGYVMVFFKLMMNVGGF